MSNCDPAELREPYSGAPLGRSALPDDPMDLFDLWFSQAAEAGLAEPNAMVLSTVDPGGAPRSRTVLLKGFDTSGLRFFTNRRSRKARALEREPRTAVLFPWHAIRRQVSFIGRAEPLGDAENDAYFRSRPRGSRIGAWASAHQSSPVTDRSQLQERYAHWEAVWKDEEEVPRPEYWGGYRIVPQEVEFWQGGSDRMHDRFRYLRTGEGSGGHWVVDRLSP
ncbi:pyridoxamine 5'-phosphate oxidase [Nocardiopsis suaedae]|uniref:Pyridoxine/pyridoxamine 5'-phosphate oxidase n=1 Tax=Nocardiopsis suaedae TaxID=3018444 RepID=A0ABT4TMD0_9ACTN|nr:pyridoxamine 5'-phosphate oxidase [Nocardiopsis suaedae]MDA2805856.1 pyridoxamine 5'-phosphate oxidase [Nocardiopsis suaedae]